MSKIYAIKLNNGNLHKNNLGEIVYFSNKQNARDYMKYNHYEGDVQQFNIDTDKDKKITDLEAKLAESEKNVEFYKERYSDATTSAYGADLMAKDYQWHLEKEIAELKQQLAEKEEQINMLEEHKFYADNIIQAYADKCKNHNQDKIELLEKVENFVKETSGIVGHEWRIDRFRVLEYIDILIKEIKGE